MENLPAYPVADFFGHFVLFPANERTVHFPRGMRVLKRRAAEEEAPGVWQQMALGAARLQGLQMLVDRCLPKAILVRIVCVEGRASDVGFPADVFDRDRPISLLGRQLVEGLLKHATGPCDTT